MGYVYKILCNVTSEVYIGSSKTEECKTGGRKYYRLSGHKWGNRCSSKTIIERGNYQFIILENNVENHLLREREHFYITNIQCVNRNVPYVEGDGRKDRNNKRSSESYQENKEEKKEKSKENYYKNRTQIREKLNTKVLCDCGVEYSLGNKLRHHNSNRHKLYCVPIL